MLNISFIKTLLKKSLFKYKMLMIFIAFFIITDRFLNLIIDSENDLILSYLLYNLTIFKIIRIIK